MSSDISEDRLVSYLLGELSEEDQIQFENQYFTDRDSLERLSAVEDDLINDYLRRELSPDQRKQFEQYFLTTPERAARLEFARDLLRTIAATNIKAPVPSSDTPPKPILWWRSLRRFRNQVLLLPVALAALLLVFVGFRLYIGQANLQGQIEQMNAELATLSRQKQELDEKIAAESDRNEQLLQELQRNESERERLKQELSAAQKMQRTIPAYSLAPVGNRSPGSKPTRITLPPKRQLAQFKLRFASEGKFKNYRAVLRKAGDGEILALNGLRVSPRAGVVFISLPSVMLTGGDYILTLYGLNDSGAYEEIEDYSFSIVK